MMMKISYKTTMRTGIPSDSCRCRGFSYHAGDDHAAVERVRRGSSPFRHRKDWHQRRHFPERRRWWWWWGDASDVPRSPVGEAIEATAAVPKPARRTMSPIRARVSSPLRREDVATPLEYWSPPKPAVSKWSMEPSPNKQNGKGSQRRKFPKPFSHLFARNSSELCREDEEEEEEEGAADRSGGGGDNGDDWASKEEAVGGSAVQVAKQIVRSRGMAFVQLATAAVATPAAPSSSSSSSPTLPLPLPYGHGPRRGEWGCRSPRRCSSWRGLQNPAVVAPHGPQLLKSSGLARPGRPTRTIWTRSRGGPAR